MTTVGTRVWVAINDGHWCGHYHPSRASASKCRRPGASGFLAVTLVKTCFVVWGERCGWCGHYHRDLDAVQACARRRERQHLSERGWCDCRWSEVPRDKPWCDSGCPMDVTDKQAKCWREL